MEVIKKKKQHQNHDLPHDIVEDILSRLPVKILLRFRSVCKQWKTTISDDRFADAHLRLSRNSLSTHLVEQLLCSHTFTPNVTRVIDVSDNHLRVISAGIDPPPDLFPPERPHILCDCDGLQLMATASRNNYNYILWNPSNRTYKLLSYPYHIEGEDRRLYGICYDPTAMNNYKVVIGGPKGYAVFNCRSNSWSELRDADNTFFSRCSYCFRGASLNGSIYWGTSTTVPAADAYKHPPNGDLGQIVCFDGRDEKLKCVRKLDDNLGDLRLLSSRNALYVFMNPAGLLLSGYEIRVMKMEVSTSTSTSALDSYTWSKIKVVRLEGVLTVIFPKCWYHQDKIMLEKTAEAGAILLLYDHTTGSAEEIYNPPELEYHPTVRGCILPPMDNIFFC